MPFSLQGTYTGERLTCKNGASHCVLPQTCVPGAKSHFSDSSHDKCLPLPLPDSKSHRSMEHTLGFVYHCTPPGVKNTAGSQEIQADGMHD